jgi:hypothetical protein
MTNVKIWKNFSRITGHFVQTYSVTDRQPEYSMNPYGQIALKGAPACSKKANFRHS